MLRYEAPYSPNSWLGKEDFWVIGDLTTPRIERTLTGSGRIARPIRPTDIGLRVRSRQEVGIPAGLNLSGGSYTSSNYKAHLERFNDTLSSNIAVIQAAGALTIAQDAELVAELCSTPNYQGVPGIRADFARTLNMLINPQIELTFD
jgi:hypothetical protein